jgi:hypothetical protein
LFALVLFVVAVSQRFRLWGVRIAAIALAVGLLGPSDAPTRRAT